MSQLSYRSIFISDVHLGTRDCRAKFLIDFLESTHCERLYLVGDIVDLWAMRRSVHWPPSHTRVLQLFFEKAERGTEVFYIPGNHDELMRDFVGSEINGVRILRDAVHVTRDGRRFLVSHGDEFDGFVRHNGLLRLLGDGIYPFLLLMNRWFNGARRRLGRPYWSLSAFIKSKVGNARRYIEKFEAAVAYAAAIQEYDGHICGHLHTAGIVARDGVLYCNDGDWVEHCTALVEDFEGRLQLLHWADRKQIHQVNEGTEVIPTLIPLSAPQGSSA